MTGKRKTKTGRVVSDKMDKTIVVAVERLARHRLYKRVIRLTTKFKAHDELNEAHVGDTVLIEESRPLSASKRWRLVAVVARAGEQHGSPAEVVGDEAETTEAIHAVAHPGQARSEAEAEPSASRGGGDRRMIQVQSRLKVADNTGARTIQCIRIMGRSPKPTGRRR